MFSLLGTKYGAMLRGLEMRVACTSIHCDKLVTLHPERLITVLYLEHV